jgi:hypothetical protein
VPAGGFDPAGCDGSRSAARFRQFLTHMAGEITAHRQGATTGSVSYRTWVLK